MFSENDLKIYLKKRLNEVEEDQDRTTDEELFA